MRRPGCDPVALRDSHNIAPKTVGQGSRVTHVTGHSRRAPALPVTSRLAAEYVVEDPEIMCIRLRQWPLGSLLNAEVKRCPAGCSSGRNYRILLENHVAEVGSDAESNVASPAGLIGVSKQNKIVRNSPSLGFTWVGATRYKCRLAAIVRCKAIKSGSNIFEYIVFNCDVIDDCKIAAVGSTRREYDGIAPLTAYPVILQEITTNDNTARVLELQVVFDRPPGRVTGCRRYP